LLSDRSDEEDDFGGMANPDQEMEENNTVNYEKLLMQQMSLCKDKLKKRNKKAENKVIG